METLGYIYSSNRLKGIADFVEVTNDLTTVPSTKPLLIVGMNNAKVISSNFSVVKRQISDNMFWTFAKTERRVDFEKDLEQFYHTVLDRYSNNIKYYYFNAITVPYSKVKNLIEIINSSKNTYIYICDEMIYIYYDSYVIGISNEILDYIGIKKEKVIKIIKGGKNVKVYEQNIFLPNVIRNIIKDKKYLTPFFLSMNLSS